MLTDRERETLAYIADHVANRGYAPKLREIAEHLGIRSRGTVHRYLRALQAAGHIRISRGRARGIELLHAEDPDVAPGHTLPLLGRIAAGHPIEAIPGEDEVDLSQFFVDVNRFVLRVQGESMIEDGIMDGDMVVVERRAVADDGDIVVALVDSDEATLKRLQRNADGTVTLVPANRAMTPLRYSAERVQIQGVLVAQFRAYR